MLNVPSMFFRLALLLPPVPTPPTRTSSVRNFHLSCDALTTPNGIDEKCMQTTKRIGVYAYPVRPRTPHTPSALPLLYCTLLQEQKAPFALRSAPDSTPNSNATTLTQSKAENETTKKRCPTSEQKQQHRGGGQGEPEQATISFR